MSTQNGVNFMDRQQLPAEGKGFASSCLFSGSPSGAGNMYYFDRLEGADGTFTGIHPNSPSLTMDQFINTTPIVVKKSGATRSGVMSNTPNLFTFACSTKKRSLDLSMKLPTRQSARPGPRLKSARRNLKDMSYGEADDKTTVYPHTATSSSLVKLCAESSYQYLPTYYSSIHLDPINHPSTYTNDSYYNDYYCNLRSGNYLNDSNVGLKESCSSDSTGGSKSDDTLSTSYTNPGMDSFVFNSSLTGSEYSSASPASDVNQDSANTSGYAGELEQDGKKIFSDLNVPSLQENFQNHTVRNSELPSTKKDVKFEWPDHSDDPGLAIGPPILYTDHLDPISDESLMFLKPTKNCFVAFCVSCINTSDRSKPCPQKIPSDHDAEVRDPQTIKVTDISNSKNGSGSGNVGLNEPPKEQTSGDEDSYTGSEDVLDVKVTSNGCCGEQGCMEHCVEQQLEMVPLDEGSHLCFGCQKPVFDRYVLHVKDHGYWHAECLKCSNCQDNLSTQTSCYVKNEQVFCRNDYNILFGLSCVKCSLQFKKEQDWMRVAGQHRYHIACFLCKICKRQLGNNEKYHLVNGTDIYCTNHYRDMVNGENSDGQQPPKKAKRNRTSYTETQIKFLQDRFLRDSNPDGGELEKIAKHIGLKKRVVQVWFQNNRARLKKSANNTKGGNQENKNPSTSNGVSGPGSMHDLQTMDWDNSMDPNSLDEQPYSSPQQQQQLRSGSGHFMDTVSMTSFGTPLLCLPPGHNSTSGNGPSSLGEGSGSGASNCDTPRDQVSPQFSDMSTSAVNTSNDNGPEDISTPGSQDFSSPTSNVCPAKVTAGSCHAPLLSALRSSVMGERFPDNHSLRMDPSDHQHLRRLMLLHEHPHHHGVSQHQQQQLHHIEPNYTAQLGMYGSFYNMYTNSYGPLHPLSGDQGCSPDSFLHHRDPPVTSYHSTIQNHMFGADSGTNGMHPSSPSQCGVGFTSTPGGPTHGPQGCPSPLPCHFPTPRAPGGDSPQLFNPVQGYGRTTCVSPQGQGRQNGGQFPFHNVGSRNGGHSFFNESSESV